MEKTREAELLDEKGGKQRFLVTEEDGELTIARCLTAGRECVTIPAQIEGVPVTAIGEDCFFDHGEIREILLPQSLKRIGAQAFALCRGIRTLELPDGIGEIGPYAFRDCRGLRRVRLPAGLKRIRQGTFSFCDLPAEAEILLPEGLETIEEGAFWSGGCFALRIPESVKEIGRGAFFFGPRVETVLPYDKGWYRGWPYGEGIRKGERERRIEEIEEIPGSGGCLLLTAAGEGGVEVLFYPCTDGEYTFTDDENQKHMAEDLGRIHGAAESCRAWRRGLI